jgi:hypothetical protein
LLAISVLLRLKAIPQGGPLQRGRITFNFSGTLSGPGTLAQIGATGTTVLTSLTNSIGAARIDAGTLQVDGGLATTR